MSGAVEKDQTSMGTAGGDEGLMAEGENAVAVSKPMFKIGGYGSLGIAHSSQSLGDYVLDGTHPKGPGRSSDWSFNNDSRIGVQASADFTPNITAVLQLDYEYQAGGSYDTDVEWANIKYAFTPNAYIRVGRIVLPTFLFSNNIKVGYSYPWVHPPIDLYRQLPMTNSDGVDAAYRFEIGEAWNSIRVVLGKGEIERATSTSTSRGLWGIFDTFEYGPTTMHIGYQERKSSSYNKLTGVTGEWIKNSDLSVGASYDVNDWFAMSEWIQRKSTTKLQAMYVSAGLHVSKVTPYLTYSQNSPASFLTGFPPPTAAAIQNAKRSEKTVSLGMRWDFMKNTDIKLQLDQVHLGSDSNGYLDNVPAGVVLYGDRFYVISTVVDFVF